jgi:hypothetical protein
MKAMTNYKGYVIQRGVSPIDGKPFVVIMTMKTTNRKTGDMVQVWILRDDVNPVEAIATGDDYSICGNCPHRKQPDGARSCYVNVGQAPLSIWKAYKRGTYGKLSDLTPQMLQGRKIRWGAYGDPALVSPILFATLNEHAAGHTGYTHQWREPWAQWCKGLFQASCDGLDDYLNASVHGWQTFAVIPKGSQAYSGKLCPATAANSQAQCATCSLCDGAKTDIFVEAHGSGAKYVATTC